MLGKLVDKKMLLKNLVILVFGLINFLSFKFDNLKNLFLFSYIIILFVQIMLYYKNIKYNIFHSNLKLNSISFVKVGMLFLLFFTFIVLLQNIYNTKLNLFSYIFVTPGHLVSWIIEIFLKPTIIFFYLFNFKQNLRFRQNLLISIFLAIILNSLLIFNFNLVLLKNFVNWILIWQIFLSVNIYFYNLSILYVIFQMCNTILSCIF